MEEILSFEKIIKRKEMNTIMFSSDNYDEQFISSLYFILKEIYYYDYLNDANLKVSFVNYLKERLVDYKINNYTNY